MNEYEREQSLEKHRKELEDWKDGMNQILKDPPRPDYEENVLFFFNPGLIDPAEELFHCPLYVIWMERGFLNRRWEIKETKSYRWDPNGFREESEIPYSDALLYLLVKDHHLKAEAAVEALKDALNGEYCRRQRALEEEEAGEGTPTPEDR